MRPANLATWMDALRDAALEAGRAILGYYGASPSVHLKADASPVTEADEAASAIIVPALERLAPQIPTVCEEVEEGRPVPSGRGLFFLVDPLDGTKEFLNQNGEFTVNIALIEDGRPIAGVVHLPALNRTFTGWRDASGSAAFEERPGAAPRPVRVRAPGTQGLVVVASRSHRDAETDRYLEGIRVASFAAAGSSLKFCLVACGEADLYPRLGRTMEWDTAAGQAVLEAAGGSVRRLDGAELRYGKPGLENPHFVARGAAPA